MTIRLDHTIVPTKNKRAAARFFAEIFDLKVKPGRGYFAQVRVNDSLTMDFADDPDAWGEPSRPPCLHFAFHVSDHEYEAILDRVKARSLPYGSEPDSPDDGRINTRRGGRGFYFTDPNGHLLEVMTVPETGS
ncbi:MAG TPA: VOC family protein [Candidatus Bathyarchaeia archaeon]|nr:VOC family protein [Candidatus Bathyarchaeia archaeon]